MQHHIQPPILLRVIIMRQQHGIGLNRTIHRRTIGSHYPFPSNVRPDGLASLCLFGSGQSLIERGQSPLAAGRCIPFRKADNVFGPFQIDFHLHQDVVRNLPLLQLANGLPKFLRLLGNPFQRGIIRHLNIWRIIIGLCLLLRLVAGPRRNGRLSEPNSSRAGDQ